MGKLVRFKGHFYDLSTSNRSFLQVAQDLKVLGVKNWYFMLEVFDPSVISIDPYSVDKTTGKCNLTKDQITRVLTECKRNPWYFLREVVRITDPGNPAGVSYKANRGNLAQAWLLLHNLDSWLCLPRQQGKTMSAIALYVWLYDFGISDSTFIFLNKDGDGSKTNLRRLGELIELLPEYMRFKSIMNEEGKTTKAKQNATEYGHPVTGNRIIIKSQATSYDKALSIARGLTAPNQYYDEPEFTPYIATIVKNSVSTFETAHRRSLENGAISARCFTCTPGDLGTKTAVEAQEILDNTIKWHDRMYDMTPEEILNIIRKNNGNGIIYIEYQYYQIGLDKEWLRNISAKIADPLTVRREILLQRINGSSLSPFPREDVEYIASTMNEPIDQFFVSGFYQFDVYEKLNPSVPYIVGVDCSTGTASDNNAITVINPYTVKPVAEFKSPYIGETDYENLIETLVLEFIPRAIVVIERNSVGDGIIDHLLNESKIANRLYYDKDKDLLQEKMKHAETTESILATKSREKTFYGVYTSGKSREDMMAILSRHVSENKDDFVTKNIITDLTKLVRSSSGKIQAASGFHDDSIMSYLIGLYVYYHGNNLQYFGFYKTDIYEGVELNQGINRPDLRSILPSEVVDRMEKDKEIEKELNYEQIFRDALRESQEQSKNLAKSKIMKSNNYFNNTERYILEDDDTESLDLGLFDSLNGF